METRLRNKRMRTIWLRFIKKQYNIYGVGGAEDLKDRMVILREAVLIAPNTTCHDMIEVPEAEDRSDYLEEVEREVAAKGYIVEEYDFDSYVYKAPDLIHTGDYDPREWSKNWHAIHDKKRERVQDVFIKNSRPL